MSDQNEHVDQTPDEGDATDPALDEEAVDLDRLGHRLAPVPDTVTTSTSERVPEPKQPLHKSTEPHRETADQLGRSGGSPERTDGS